MKKIPNLSSLIILAIALLLSSCAVVTTEQHKEKYEQADVTKPFLPYNGVKKRVQILRFGVPDEIAKKYPELTDKRVGWGLYNRLIEGFYETNRFEFIEEKEEIMKKVVDQWALSQSGLVAQDEELKSAGLSAPQYLIYAEVYEFSVSHSEVLVGMALEKKARTIMGIQLRILDASTGKYLPASGVGEAVSTVGALWVNPQLTFDQSTVGIATQKAVNVAMRNLLDRMDK